MKNLFPAIPTVTGERVVLKRITEEDAGALQAMTENPRVYRYLPAFLFEKKYDDTHLVIERLYDEGLRESLILGIYLDGVFTGIAEAYGFRDPIHKISVGYRLAEEFWGRGIATEALGLLTGYLLKEKGIEIITASTMLENQASARVLRKSGFALVVHDVGEDWGYDKPTAADKWIL